ncbi:hypothetical protein MLD38_037984 [Melastoma candidum]|uniref:Uncharacterized protein n=1 Tax=Melastoma candidum TaxID=119954 RepID=A0ACB9KYH3_9MYRT|nr:hypothetical protein MLD38_037984 [Melastoma candidum]
MPITITATKTRRAASKMAFAEREVETSIGPTTRDARAVHFGIKDLSFQRTKRSKSTAALRRKKQPPLFGIGRMRVIKRRGVLDDVSPLGNRFGRFLSSSGEFTLRLRRRRE